jgi:hypothetical protein
MLHGQVAALGSLGRERTVVDNYREEIRFIPEGC